MNELERALAALERLELGPRQVGPKQWVACCPLHDERQPSFGLAQGRVGQALYHCFKCSDAAVDDFRDALGIPMERTNGTLEEQQADPLPSEADIKRWCATLLGREKTLAALRRLRGWSAKTLAGYEVGLDGNSLVFPQRAVAGELVQVIRYQPGKKTLALKGHPRPLWPQPEQFLPDRVVWIVEGESDALSACELGLRGVSVPGVNGWRQEYAQRFTGRTVKVCLDCDPQGRKAGHRIVGELRALGIDAEYVDLDRDRTDGYDLTDFLLDALGEDGGLASATAWLGRASGRCK